MFVPDRVAAHLPQAVAGPRHHAAGRLLLDPGAVRAVTERRTSLLPAGITGVEGTFADGDPVDLCAPEGG